MSSIQKLYLSVPDNFVRTIIQVERLNVKPPLLKFSHSRCSRMMRNMLETVSSITFKENPSTHVNMKNHKYTRFNNLYINNVFKI